MNFALDVYIITHIIQNFIASRSLKQEYFMNNALGFFRVFDVAFFVPGAIIVASFMQRYQVFDKLKSTETLSINDISILVLVTISSFVTGLIIHGIGQFVKPLLSKVNFFTNLSNSSDCIPRWYKELSTERKNELAIYFWYIRSTCINCSISLLISWLLLFFKNRNFTKLLGLSSDTVTILSIELSLFSLIWLGSSFFLLLLSTEFGNARNKYTNND